MASPEELEASQPWIYINQELKYPLSKHGGIEQSSYVQ